MTEAAILDGAEGEQSPSAFPPLACNTSDEILYANIRAAAERGLPLLNTVPAHDGVAILAGGGPSLADDLAEMCDRVVDGARIFALGNVAQYLISRGIMPYAQILLDARPFNRRFAEHRSAIRYFVASQCDPSVFDLLASRDVTLWHPNMDGKSGVKVHEPTVLVGGGSSVGIRAMNIAHILGYRDIHLYGYDSSYRDGEGHAYRQPENDGDDTEFMKVRNGPTFRCARWMAKQAQVFPKVARDLADQGCRITVHGTGLLPAVARAMNAPQNYSHALYDFSTHPAGYDFTTWLVKAEMMRRLHGAPAPLRVKFQAGRHGGFRAYQISEVYSRKMLNNVLRPALEMLGAVEDETITDGVSYDYTMSEIVDLAREGHTVPFWQAPRRAVHAVNHFLAEHEIVRPVVITLRETEHHPVRNSNIAAWTTFAHSLRAKGYPVVIVRDTERASEPLDGLLIYPLAATDIHVRTALYQRALCNLQVANGPGILAYLSDVPYLIFKNLIDQNVFPWPTGTAWWWENIIHVPEGTQYPWATDLQRFTWTDDTLENIEAAWAGLALPRE